MVPPPPPITLIKRLTLKQQTLASRCPCCCPPVAGQTPAAERAAASGTPERPQEEQPAAAEPPHRAGDNLQRADRQEVQERVCHQRPEDEASGSGGGEPTCSQGSCHRSSQKNYRYLPVVDGHQQDPELSWRIWVRDGAFCFGCFCQC